MDSVRENKQTWRGAAVRTAKINSSYGQNVDAGQKCLPTPQPGKQTISQILRSMDALTPYRIKEGPGK